MTIYGKANMNSMKLYMTWILWMGKSGWNHLKSIRESWTLNKITYDTRSKTLCYLYEDGKNMMRDMTMRNRVLFACYDRGCIRLCWNSRLNVHSMNTNTKIMKYHMRYIWEMGEKTRTTWFSGWWLHWLRLLTNLLTMPELNKDLIEKALSLTGKIMDDMECPFCEFSHSKSFSYPIFFSYILSPEFIHEYYWKYGDDVEWIAYPEDYYPVFWTAIWKFQSWNPKPLTELLKKI